MTVSRTPLANPLVPQGQWLTHKQAEIFRFAYEHTRDRGYQPTIRELMEYFDLKSPNAIHVHIKPMIKKGWIGPHDPKGTSAARSWTFLRRPDGSPFDGFADKAPTIKR